MRTLGQLFALLIVVGLIAKYIWWITAAIGLVVLARMAWRGYLQARNEFEGEVRAVADRRRQLVARADRQHAWAMAGDPRGVYGDYPPAVVEPVL
jgi:hypothetical protein